MCFFLPSALIELLLIFVKKHFFSVDKKNSEKKNSFQEIKNFFQTMFFFLFFSIALIDLI